MLADAAGLLLKALKSKPDILVLNKFGKVEAEGSGLRDVLAATLDLEIPVLVGVPFRNIDQWRAFAGDMAQEGQVGSCALKAWLKEVKSAGQMLFLMRVTSLLRVGFGTDLLALAIVGDFKPEHARPRGRMPIPGEDTYHFRAASFSSRALRSSSGEAEPP